MAKIEINPGCPLHDGLSVIFKAPCNCDEVDGVIVNGMEFSFRDAHGNDLTGIGDLFVAGAVVKALLDTVNRYAYIQNADTNAYLEDQLRRKAPAYTYGTEEIEAGTASPYETGTIHFIYEPAK